MQVSVLGNASKCRSGVNASFIERQNNNGLCASHQGGA